MLLEYIDFVPSQQPFFLWFLTLIPVVILPLSSKAIFHLSTLQDPV